MTTLEELSRLPLEDRLQLVQDLWDSIAKETQGLQGLSEEQKQEIDRRLEEMDRAPQPGIP